MLSTVNVYLLFDILCGISIIVPQMYLTAATCKQQDYLNPGGQSDETF